MLLINVGTSGPKLLMMETSESLVSESILRKYYFSNNNYLDMVFHLLEISDEVRCIHLTDYQLNFVAYKAFLCRIA